MTGGLVAELQRQRDAWETRPLVRRLYRGWYERMGALLADVPGPTVELGAGIGTLRESLPQVVATDVAPTPWATEIVDAQALPYPDGSVANLVMVDTLHHVPHPLDLLREAARSLAPGGRLLALEPYGSPLSALAYRIGHREVFDLRADPFAAAPQSSDAPLDANGAVPTVLFFRRLERTQALFPELKVIHRSRLAVLAYPLSGGFLGRPLVPARLGGPLLALERLLEPLAPLAGFRCLVALERG